MPPCFWGRYVAETSSLILRGDLVWSLLQLFETKALHSNSSNSFALFVVKKHCADIAGRSEMGLNSFFSALTFSNYKRVKKCNSILNEHSSYLWVLPTARLILFTNLSSIQTNSFASWFLRSCPKGPPDDDDGKTFGSDGCADFAQGICVWALTKICYE